MIKLSCGASPPSANFSPKTKGRGKMKLAYALFVTFSAFPIIIFGGDSAGSGGDSILCEKPYSELSGKKAMLLDHYEARVKWDITIDLGGSALTIDEKVLLGLSRLERIDPDRFGRYSKSFKTFWSEAVIGNFSLPVLPDVGVVPLPGEDCEIVRLAHQREPEWPGDIRYTIRQRVWNEMDSDSQAGLVLHEIIYREGISLNHVNSRPTRYLNAHISSELIPEMGQEKYTDVLELAKFPAYRTLNHVPFYLRTLRFSPEGIPVEGEVYREAGAPFKYFWVIFPKGAWIHLHPNGGIAEAPMRFARISGNLKLSHSDNCVMEAPDNSRDWRMNFYPNGAIASIDFVRWINIPICYSDETSIYLAAEAKGNTFQFYPNGMWYGGWALNTDIYQKLRVGKGKGVVNKTGRVDFHESGFVKFVTLAWPEMLYDQSGGLKDYPMDTAIAFDENGLVIPETTE